MNDRPQDNTEMTPEPAPKSEVDRGRRRLGTLGVSGTAVVLSVTSRSAVAGWGTCTGSELASGNLSRAGSANPCGCSPGFWWNNNGQKVWVESRLATDYPLTMSFNALFGLLDETYLANSVTLATVGGAGGVQPKFGPKSGAKQAVAAVLNAAYFGARYPVEGYQNPLAVIAAFKACFAPPDKEGKKALIVEFVKKVDIYKTTSNLWCNGKEE